MISRSEIGKKDASAWARRTGEASILKLESAKVDELLQASPASDAIGATPSFARDALAWRRRAYHSWVIVALSQGKGHGSIGLMTPLRLAKGHLRCSQPRTLSCQDAEPAQGQQFELVPCLGVAALPPRPFSLPTQLPERQASRESPEPETDAPGLPREPLPETAKPMARAVRNEGRSR